MCGVSLREEKSSDELLGRLEIVSKADVVWYGHVEMVDVEEWVSKCRRFRGRGRPKKTWEQSVKCDNL